MASQLPASSTKAKTLRSSSKIEKSNKIQVLETLEMISSTRSNITWRIPSKYGRSVHNFKTSGHRKWALALRLTWASVFLALIQPTSAIFNCFAPNGMFSKMSSKHQSPYSGMASWSPTNQLYQTPGWPPSQSQYYHHMPAGLGLGGVGFANPMRMLFGGHKWRHQGGLFGGFKAGSGPTSWRMNPYRMPSAYQGGYVYPTNSISASTGTFNIPEPVSFGQQVAPLRLPSSSAQLSAPGSYDGGWSIPAPQTSGSYSVDLSGYQVATPSSIPTSQRPYGSIGGTGAGIKTLSGTTSTTKNSVLLADAGYNAFDALLMANGLANTQAGNYGLEHNHPQLAFANKSHLGYAYPDWYTNSGSAIDSPARIAQQLIKQGLKKQRLELHLQQKPTKSATSGRLVAVAANLSKDQLGQLSLTMDEPRFVGFGTVDKFGNQEVRLSCSFNEAIDNNNQPVWVRFLGPYNSSQLVDGKTVPPFNCLHSQCRIQEIEPSKDARFRFDHGPAVSTLIIKEPHLSDYGAYRCSALTKAINDNPLQTIYQVVRYGIGLA